MPLLNLCNFKIHVMMYPEPVQTEVDMSHIVSGANLEVVVWKVFVDVKCDSALTVVPI